MLLTSHPVPSTRILFKREHPISDSCLESRPRVQSSMSVHSQARSANCLLLPSYVMRRTVAPCEERIVIDNRVVIDIYIVVFLF